MCQAWLSHDPVMQQRVAISHSPGKTNILQGSHPRIDEVMPCGKRDGTNLAFFQPRKFVTWRE
jgi:hypothetical protein